MSRVAAEERKLDGWAVVNVNVRPYYAEGSKTIAFEIARQLGWRTPDVVVAPLASGSLYTKLAQGFDELTEVGLVERTPIRYLGGQGAGCAPIARMTVAEPLTISPPAKTPRLLVCIVA